MTDRLLIAQARAAGMKAPADRPSQRRWSADLGVGSACVRAALEVRSVQTVEREGLTGILVGGLASVTEQPYEMYDMFGPYAEVVSRDAFDATLAQSPEVEFTVNHGAGGSLPMAHTRNGTLVLAAIKDGEAMGLGYEAFVDPSRTDVATMLKALERGDLAEASFRFRIDAGRWSPDYSEYRIDAVDLSRGDVSAVNFGANPAATSALREAQVPAQARSMVLLPDDLFEDIEDALA